MKNFLVEKLKKTALAGIIGASAIYSSGCALMLDSRCKDKTIRVTSSEDDQGGVEIQLVSDVFNKVIQIEKTPCNITLYRNGDNISGARTPLQPRTGNYTIHAYNKKNFEHSQKNPSSFVQVKRIAYKTSPYVLFDILPIPGFFPIAAIIESTNGGGKYYLEENVHFNFSTYSPDGTENNSYRCFLPKKVK